MAKLYFRYGTVASAKTLNLLAVAHNYQQQKKKVLLVKPAIDTRFGDETVRSRAGLAMRADLALAADGCLSESAYQGVDCILVDEVQFFSAAFIDHLRHIATHRDIPILCYGLRTDFTRRAFPGSLRLLELADSIEEVKTTCTYCAKKAIFNLKWVHGHPVAAGPQIELGCEEKYLPVCGLCYDLKLSSHAQPGPAVKTVPADLSVES